MILPLDNKTLAQGIPRSPAMIPVPTLIGLISSMMGIGGGSLSVPTMTAFGEPIHRAVGTAALFGLSIAVPGTLGFMITGFGNPLLPPGSIGFVNLFGLALIALWLGLPLGLAFIFFEESSSSIAMLFRQGFGVLKVSWASAFLMAILFAALKSSAEMGNAAAYTGLAC